MKKESDSSKIKIRLMKMGIHIIFFVCIYLSIRWTDWPVINNSILKRLFVHTEKVDSTLLNLVTGYITGYVIYILTVVIPDLNRKEPARKFALNEVATIYNKSVYLLLLMCKNCCDTFEEWNEIISENDIESFNDKFFAIME